jgi:hypothetical protein
MLDRANVWEKMLKEKSNSQGDAKGGDKSSNTVNEKEGIKSQSGNATPPQGDE